MSNSSKIIIKIAEEVRTDKNGKNYKVIQFVSPTMVNTPFGEVMLPYEQCAKGTKTVWLNDGENGYYQNDLEVSIYKAPIFNKNNPALGGYFLGSIEKRVVPTYYIDNNEVNTYSMVIFGDTTSPTWEQEVKKAFLNAGHNLDYLPTKETKHIKFVDEEEVITTTTNKEEVVKAESLI